MTDTKNIKTYNIEWQGIALQIRFEPFCTDMVEDTDQEHVPHLEIISLSGEPHPLSITGYKSHITESELINPIEYAKSWLDHEAKSEHWKHQIAHTRQFGLN